MLSGISSNNRNPKKQVIYFMTHAMLKVLVRTSLKKYWSTHDNRSMSVSLFVDEAHMFWESVP